MLRVTLRGSGLPTVTLGSGETLLFGRSPHQSIPDGDADDALRTTAIALPRCAPHVSRLLGELVVGEEIARLRWHGSGETQVSSLFDAPGGARRVTLAEGMSLLLDEGENQLVVMRGRQTSATTYDDLAIVVEVTSSVPEPAPRPAPSTEDLAGETVTAPAPHLPRESREWYVALALAEPWLSGTDDYPRPPSNREIYERILEWHGYAWNLERAQRVDDAIRSISALAFGPKDDPFRAGTGRAQNVRFAIGRRTAEVRLVTVEDLELADRAAARRNVPPASP
ncbi:MULTISPECIES: hypothetical protein [unclassified Nocardioides]|uniref:hypothetical protein n=1 Tax=unclassified Nocardioides TaxID=2615069 RepID=UPI0009F055EC|nr:MULTISPECIES: hypothetical protein [unclassified Nocardioides]GAW47815.1 uncharacterized protein PD653B2_0125 [Nocardioides sp. PD653-B2]GAW53551.1 uncharacterized protein PD653_0950 [Nocardioides sp. PD653]